MTPAYRLIVTRSQQPFSRPHPHVGGEPASYLEQLTQPTCASTKKGKKSIMIKAIATSSPHFTQATPQCQSHFGFSIYAHSTFGSDSIEATKLGGLNPTGHSVEANVDTGLQPVVRKYQSSEKKKTIDIGKPWYNTSISCPNVCVSR